MSCKNIFQVREKEKEDKNNLQLKFYTWLGIEPSLAQTLRTKTTRKNRDGKPLTHINRNSLSWQRSEKN